MATRTSFIPVSEIRPLLLAGMEKMEDNDLDPSSVPRGQYSGRETSNNYLRTTVLQQVAWQSGLNRRTLWEILYGKRLYAHFNTVDKLVSGWLGDPSLWQREPLNRYYRSSW